MYSVNRRLAISVAILIAYLCAESYCQSCSKKSDIVFVVDQSGSIRDQNPTNGSWDNWELIKNFIVEVIRSSEVSYTGVHFALLTFGNLAVTRFGLLDHLDIPSLTQAVRDVPPGQGQTNLYGGLYVTRTEVLSLTGGARSDVPQIIIVITDGKANLNVDQTIPEAKLIQDAGIRIFAIGITGSIDEDQIMQVSSPPHQKGVNYWTTPDFTSLYEIVQSVQNATCDPPKEDLEDCRTIDVCFAIDVPQTALDFVIVKSFIKRFISLFLQIGADNVRVCIITFDNRQAQLRIPLNRYYVEDDLKMGIDDIPFVASNNGDPTYALQLAANTVFTPSNGARGSNFRPTLVTMLNNALPNRAAAIAAFNTLNRNGIRSIAFGMTYDISINELGVLTYVGNDVISSTAYDQLNSKVQALSSVLCGNGDYVICPLVADICLVLDQSTSIVSPPGTYDNWMVYIIGFAKSVATAFPISMNDTRVGVVKFSTSAQVAFYLDQYPTRDGLLNSIEKLEIQGGETNIAAGIRLCRTEIFSPSRGSRANVPHIVILITDGRANIEATQTLTEANMTKAAGAEVFTVGITANVDANQLRQICSFPPETHFFYVDDFSKLNTILSDLIQRSCNSQSTTSGAAVSTTTTTTTRAPTTPSTSRPSSSPSTSTSSTTTVFSSPNNSTTTTIIRTPTSVVTTVCTSVTTTTSATGSTTTTTASPGTICSLSADVVLILDQSTSIVYARGGYDNWYKYILGFAAGIASAFDISATKTQVGVVKFSESAEPSIYLYDHQDKASLVRAIQSLDINGGETNIASACRMTRVNLLNARYGARSGVPRIVIMLTDGEANRERNSTIMEADLLKATGARFFTIGITDQADVGQLKQICSQPSDMYYFYVNDYSQLSTIQSAVIARACNQLPVEITSTTTTVRPPTSISSTAAPTTTTTTQSTSTSRTTLPLPTSTSTTVQPFSTTTTRPVSNVTGPNPIETSCPAIADVVIVLDQSTSIVYAEGSYSNWYDHILGFAKNLSSSFQISSTVTQVAVVKFSGSATLSFKLNAYNTVQGVVNAINNLEIEGGETNIAAALRLVRTSVCTTANGARSGAKCAIILLTDGEANRETNMTIPEADSCKTNKIEIFTLGITNRTNPIQLQSIASLPVSTHYYYVDDYKQLGNVRNTIAKNVCDSLRIERT